LKDPETGKRIYALSKMSYGSGCKRSNSATRHDGAISGKARNAFSLVSSNADAAAAAWRSAGAIATTVRHAARKAPTMPTEGLLPTSYRVN